MFGQALSFLVVAITCIGCAKKSTDNYEPKTFSEQLVRQAEAGDPVAQLQLGGAYSKGRGVEKNEALAFRWIKTSAEQGYARALGVLAQCYYLGEGVPKDETKALEYAQQSAEKNYAESQYNLAAFLNQKGDYAEAFRWMKQSAENGFADGQFILGKMYEKGQGCDPDIGKATQWYQEAAGQGQREAAQRLGFLYQNGWGVKRDEAEAIRWYQRAGRLGDTNAATAVQNIRKGLEYEQSLPAPKRQMLRKATEAMWRRAAEAERTGTLPKPDPSQYEVLWSLSQEEQRFYVEEILLSEDESMIGIFSANLKLDPEGNWALGAITPRIIRIEDLKNQEKNYRFRLTPSRGRSDLIQPSETGKKKEYSRFMTELFGQYGQTRAENVSGPWEYRVTNNEIAITRYTGNEEAVKVPGSIGGVPVKSIQGMAFMDCAGLRAVEIPDGVARIGFWSFRNCTNLTSVKLGKDLKEIGGYAFAKCTKLEEISFPVGLQTIGEEAFTDCSSLKKISLPDTVTRLGRNCFFKCRALEKVRLGNGIQVIESYAFYGCSSLTEIRFPDGLARIEEGAFEYCPNLAPESLEKIRLVMGRGNSAKP